ncbi:hypothetical protein ES703_53849 [subsurface metagenome]
MLFPLSQSQDTINAIEQSATVTQAIQGSSLNQALQHPLVYTTQVTTMAQVFNRGEVASLIALSNNRLYSPKSHILNSGQPEADG